MQVHETSQSSFTKNAKLYDSVRPSYIPSAVDAIISMCDITKESRIIDLACGTGIFTRLLLKRGLQVTGIDPSPGMRETFTEQCDAPCLDGSAYNIPFPDNSIDVVTIAQAFHWFDNQEALQELHRVLKPNGRVGMIWNLEKVGVSPLTDAYFHTVTECDADVPQYRTGRWRTVLNETQLFTAYKEWMDDFSITYTPEELWQRTCSKSFITALPDSDQASLKQRLDKLCSESKEIINGRFECPHSVRVISLTAL